MKVVIYARVSTDDKDQNPDRQLMKCRQYCELHDHEIVAELVDYFTGDSSLFERPEGCKIKEMKVDGIVFNSMDRLTRQHPNKMMLLLQYLKDSGITPISATEPAFNLESDFAEVILYIMAYFNNYYLKELKKNVKSGLDRARKEGKTLGRPKNKVNLYAVAREASKEGASVSSVASALGVSRSSAYRSIVKAKEKGMLKGD
mgnify:CR=1 FL=1